MKTYTKSDYSSERSQALLRNFRESLARQSQISTKRAFQEAADAPAPRFWVSEARACRIVSSLMKGIDLTEGMHPLKRKMFLEIYARCIKIKNLHPETPLGDIVFEVVNNPAPSSYLTWHSALKIINNYRKS